jgi:hypothetical protein
MAGRIAYYGGIVTNGLVLALDAAKKDSYPGSGTLWRDISGNGNNGTLTNGPTFNSGNGGSIVFDGVNDYVQYETSLDPYISGNRDFTIELWVYKNTSGDGMIFSSWDDIPNRKFYIGYIGNTTALSPQQKSSKTITQLKHDITYNNTQTENL